jgi:putative hydrolase of the HAD superfamily
VRAVVFDLDDTLYPERDFVASGYRSVAGWVEEHLGLPAGEVVAELSALAESAPGRVFDEWVAARGLDADTALAMVAAYRGHSPTLEPFPGIRPLLTRLRARYRLGLVTDGYLEVQRRKLAGLGLAGEFDAVVFSDELGREHWKPSTEPFRTVLEALGVDGAEAVYVADNPLKDFLGARRMRMRTIQVARGDGVYAHVTAPTPDHSAEFRIDDLGGLEGLLAPLSRPAPESTSDDRARLRSRGDSQRSELP